MNEDGLRRGLATVARPVEGYDVVDAALRGARRRVAVRRVGATAGIVALVALLLIGPAGAFGTLRGGGDAVRPAAPSDGTVLPARLGRPWDWAPTVEESPPGRAAVVFSGHAMVRSGDWFYWNPTYVVGADPRAHRRLGDDAEVGRDTFVSPDGTAVATRGGSTTLDRGIEVHDLRSGRVTQVGAPATLSPLGWAPDGRSVAVLRFPEGSSLSASDVGVLDLTTGRYRPLWSGPGIDAQSTNSYLDGAVAAFSPDGRTLAVDAIKEVRLLSADGRSSRTIAMPPRTRLAGTGAFTPDGRAFAMVRTDDCCSDPAAAIVGLLDVDTGATRPGTAYPAFAGGSVRVLGWRGTAAMVVLQSDRDRTAVVALLTPGAAAPTVMMRTPEWTTGIYIPSRSIPDATFRGTAEPSPWPVSRRWSLPGLLLLGLLLVCVVPPVALVLRRRRAW